MVLMSVYGTGGHVKLVGTAWAYFGASKVHMPFPGPDSMSVKCVHCIISQP